VTKNGGIAPTGAHKTYVALLEVLSVLRKRGKFAYMVSMNSFATKIALKYRRQLKLHNFVEYTGDTIIQRDGIRETDILMSNSEKFDVATRIGIMC